MSLCKKGFLCMKANALSSVRGTRIYRCTATYATCTDQAMPKIKLNPALKH
jgi:hypothetical protein